ncbi:MAG: hypothetical protein M1831_000138 [Alyxoria varia]|nr:MAG: hypothetical protein M1831_000138 [Alyxoria varia]
MAINQPSSRAGALAQVPITGPSQPPGTFVPGTKVQVGGHRVVVEKYLSEGGFAHVYVVHLSGRDGGSAVLKRVAVPDKEALASMRTEVETMKRVKGHKQVVSYIDSHASQLKGGGYEVFLLMEYCAGGGLIDFMNTRLKNRLTEPEILEIFGDAAEGVACMHYLQPPLLHRDLKVENILISTTPSSKMYKLCDFGSAAPPRPAATSAAEGRLIEDDIQRHTTLQYRSPEMVDVYRKQPIDEKSDIWALGVLLYKLCYYTTPFEEQGQMAILNASFKYPSYPPFSDRLKKLIAVTLSADPRRRPTIYQVVKEACSMRSKECPIKDIYANRSHSEARNNQQLPPGDPEAPAVGARLAPPETTQQKIPEVAPMRRGRPGKESHSAGPPKASPSPNKHPDTDPFAALDSSNYSTRAAAVDELSGRFPSVDEFSLLQNQESKFQFGTESSKRSGMDQKVMHALADEAFVKPAPSQETLKPTTRPESVAKDSPRPPKFTPHENKAPQAPPKSPKMVSTGTMTSRPSSPKDPKPSPKQDHRSIWRIPINSDSPRLSALARFDSFSSKHQPPRSVPESPPLIGENAPTSPVSSRPSLEGSRPSSLDVSSESLQRSKSASARPEVANKPKYSDAPLPPRHESVHKSDSKKRRSLIHPNSDNDRLIDLDSPLGPDDAKIASNVEYLRAMEEREAAKGHHRRGSSFKQFKHASMPSVSLHGTKHALAGKFGDTFRRFEGGRHGSKTQPHESLLIDQDGDELEKPTDLKDVSRNDVDEDAIDETEDLSPEVRRELERRRLSQEEKRVADGAAEYRRRLAGDSLGGQRSSKATAIQDRVKTLLEESGRSSPVKKSAEGYGHHSGLPQSSSNPQAPDVEEIRRVSTIQQPAEYKAPSKSNVAAPQSLPQFRAPESKSPNLLSSARPAAPPKPHRLTATGTPISPNPNTTGKIGTAKQSSSTASNPYNIQQRSRTENPTSLQPTQPSVDAARRRISSPKELEDPPASTLAGETSPNWEASFAKRFPSLSLEMVETEIEAVSTTASKKGPSRGGGKAGEGGGEGAVWKARLDEVGDAEDGRRGVREETMVKPSRLQQPRVRDV